MKDLQVFNFEDNHTRIALVDGEPWIVAKDVAEALGYSESSITNMGQMLNAVPDDWKGRKRITTPGGEQRKGSPGAPVLHLLLG